MAISNNATGNKGLTANLLPGYYQTPANKKFLQATLDQLFQPGTVTKTNGFIGRENAKAATGADNYVAAVDSNRQNYQLEPGLTIKDQLGNVTFFKDYIDYINQLTVFGGNTKNHARVNKQEFYSWDPHIDWDKFVNFQNYYWLPYGPDSIKIYGQPTAITSTYTVKIQSVGPDNQYIFTPDGFTPDPILKLYKGHTYHFEINSPGNPFSIKTERIDGQTGRYYVKGIDNYAVTDGVITFTVPLDAPSVLYYQSESDINLGGSIEVYGIDENTFIDVEKDFLGKKTYKLSNGTAISNGMRVSFGGNVIPDKYATGDFYVDGVGSAIKLVPTAVLEIITPYTVAQTVPFDSTPFESTPFSDATGYASVQDYITINRTSRDHNPWSRYNRWFHQDVIKASAAYNKTSASLDQSARATRPIIEFDADLKLYNFGTTAIVDVDFVDNFTTDIFSIIEGSIGYNIDGKSINQGHRILVTADTDPMINNRIYQVEFIDVKHLSTNSQQIHLVEVATPELNQVVIVKDGVQYYSQMFWYNGTTWVEAQQKTDTNQAPLFDIVDDMGVSFGDRSVYDGSTFNGTELFSYKKGTGTSDKVLGFPLSYQNVANIGDIVFNFNLATDSFQYKESTAFVKKNIDVGYLVGQTYSGSTIYENGWITSTVTTVQPAIRIYKNSNQTNNFNIDIFDDISNLKDLVVRIYINGIRLDKTEWSLVNTTIYKRVVLTNPIALTDVLTIKAFAAQPINSNGYYEIPINLQNNPLNESMIDFTLGEVSDHVNSIVDNLDNTNFSGSFPGTSNLRDIGKISSLGTKFVQHSGPVSLSLYHITNESTNVIRAIETARDDYNSFKRNFLATASSLGVDTDAPAMVELILLKMNANKPTIAPYYFSDMVPYGAKLVTNLTVVDYRVKQYPLTTAFTLANLSNKSVGVYLNGVQLVHGQDYTFDAQAFITVTATLTNGDIISTYEYESTDGSFVPATPTKLGLWPKFIPHIYTDTSLLHPQKMIQGHDGSQILAYNDYRDDLILELEKRIFNNIKTEYDPTIFDINDIIPSYNRTNTYSLTEFNEVLAPSFYKWTGLIGADFTKPMNFNIADPFTYNYSKSYAPDQVTVTPGYWRGVYRYLLDTDRPNLCPWEMLGYSIMPTWWVDLYGPAPYTGDNLVMWQDISLGIIREPGKPVVYSTKYAKPFLMDHIPVDELGNLKDPTVTALARGTIRPSADGNYIFGDVAPVEAAWRRSSYYPFSVLVASLLLTPANTFGLLLDRSRIVRNIAGQLIYKDTGLRLRPMDIVLPSLYSSSTRVHTSGIINYIVDLILNYIFSNNIASYNKYASDLSLMVPQLSYRVGSFTNKDQFNLLLESKTPLSTGNVFVPKEDYSVFLNTSSPVKKLTYSGVMITKLQTGYQVRGYSKTQPAFYTYEYAQSGLAVNVGGISQSYAMWTAGEQYIVGTIVNYGDRYYRTVVAHTAKDNFEESYFQILPNLPVVGGTNVIFRKSWDKSELITVPYGTEFTSAQEVTDFLIGYGEYLKDQGFTFDDYNSNLGVVLNWETSAKEFLFWSTQNWSTGQDKWNDWRPNQEIAYGTIVRFNGEYFSAVTNIPSSPEFNPDDFNKLNGLSNAGASVISLSPSASAVTFNTTLSVVDNIGNRFNDYEIFKVDGTAITPQQLDSYRSENSVTYAPRTTDGIYCASFYLIQNEHVIIINNTDIFNDIIYNPASGYRRERIKVSGYVTTGWYGGLDIPGFIFDAATIQEWQPWQDYNMGDIILHQGHYYSANTFLAGSTDFVAGNWTVLANKPSPAIMPNWTNLATQFTDFYSLEVDGFDAQQQKMAQHLIGYQKRQYLENIIQDDVSEFKFYQGMIREKGTQNVLNKLFNILSTDNEESLTFYEEWALRVGQYGASQAFEDVEFVLDEGTFKNNPQGVALVPQIDSTVNSFVIQQTPNDVYLKPKGYNSKPFPVISNYKPLLRSAGYVNPNDVFVSLGHLSEITSQDISKFNNGAYIWVAFEGASWNIYRYTDINLRVTEITYSGTAKQLTITTKNNVNLEIGSYIGISQMPQNNGFYQVVSTKLNSFVVSADLKTWDNPLTGNNSIIVYSLISQRTNSVDNLDSISPQNLIPGEILWTDDRGDGIWASWKYNPVYKEQEVVNISPAIELKYGSNIAVSKLGNLMAASDDSGNITIFAKSKDLLDWSQTQVLSAPKISTQSINMSVSAIAFSSDNTWLAVGTKSASYISSSYVEYDNSPSTSYSTGAIIKYQNVLYQTSTAVSNKYYNVAGYDISTGPATIGQGAIFDVIVSTVTNQNPNAPRYYIVKVTYGGIGYKDGNTIQISGIQLGGTSADNVTIIIPPGGTTSTSAIDNITWSDAVGGSNNTFISGAPISKNKNNVLRAKTTTGVSGTVVPGNSAKFDVVTSVTGYTSSNIIIPNSATGAGYLVGDQVLIKGSTIGGKDIINDLILTVKTTNLGAITDIETTVVGNVVWRKIPYIPANIKKFGNLTQSGDFALGNTYQIVAVGTTDWNSIAGTSGIVYASGDLFVAANTGSVRAGDFIPGNSYIISNVGTTNFILYGAKANTVGTTFIATDIGAGSGIALNGNGTAIEQIQATDSSLVNQGAITIYKKSSKNEYSIVDTIISSSPADGELFGSSLEFGNSVLYIGALGANSSAGRIYKMPYSADTTTAITLSYNPVGSSDTVLALTSTNVLPIAGIGLGMTITGNGFTSKQTVTELLSSSTVAISATPDTTPSGLLTFAYVSWRYDFNFTLTGASASNALGSVIKLNADESMLVASEASVVNVYELPSKDKTVISQIGSSIAVSNDGNYIAIGTATVGSDQNGFVNVYTFGTSQYDVVQTIADHRSEINERFGSKIAFMNNSKTLVVYSQGGNTNIDTTFDNATTSFDRTSTQFTTLHPGSGRVDIYDIYATKWVYSESLPTTDSEADGYGLGFAVTDNQVIVSAPYATDAEKLRSGQVYSYVKQANNYSWNIDRTQSLIPNIKKVKQAFLYNKALGTLVEHLDVIDPLQGKIPGPADEEIRYKTFYDPAVYSDNTTTTGVNVDTSAYWSKNQVGQLWWNLSTAKFVETYFGDVSYRNNNWNSLAPGASIDVCEWVESKLLPAQWDAQADTPAGLVSGISGKSLYGNNTYSTRQQYNSITKNFVNTYYYWVKNKSLVPYKPGRHISAQDVASLIANPRGQAYTYLALLGPDSFSLTNARQYLKGTDVVLAVEYWLTDKTDQNMHTQWKLISDDSIVDLPHTIEQKWFDSLCGVDTVGRSVPDLTQPPKLRYGIENRPRQSMFVNRIEALKEFVERANKTLILNQISENYNISSLESYDAPPKSTTGLYDKVLDTDAEIPFFNIESFVRAKLTPVIVNGSIVSVTIDFAGSGYLIAPTVTVYGPGIGAVLKTTINTFGQITQVDIISKGQGYDNSNTTIVVRTYCILVNSDSGATGNWSIYAYEPSTSVWSRILTQAYDVRNYWNYVDWYATGYTQYTAPDYAVNTFVDLNSITPKIGQLVKIRTVNTGGWLLLYKYADSTSIDWTQSYIIVGIENGTIQLSSKLYNFKSTNIGYDSDTFDGGSFDVVASTELRIILNTIRNNIFIGALKQNYLDLFIAAIHYAHSEQVYLDWAFKTSFVRATHTVGNLDQPVNYPVDNISNFEDYVAEVIPYRSKLREYISNYKGIDLGQSAVTDFDLQPTFINNSVVTLDSLYTTNGVSVTSDLIQQYPWKFWLDNLGFVVTDLILVDGGKGYVTPPEVIIENPTGTGASARAFITNGIVTRVVLMTKGSGYLSAPTVTINGGLGIGGTVAKVTAIIGDSVVRSSMIGIKFDRINYNYYISNVTKTKTFSGSGSRLQFALPWAPDVRIGQSSVYINKIPVLREMYTLAVVKTKYQGVTTYTGTITFKSAPATGVDNILVNYTIDQSLLSFTDRIQYFYNPTAGQPGKDLPQLMTGVDYGGVQVNGLGFSIGNGWGSSPFYSDKWDNFDTEFNDYFVTVAADTRTFTLPYTATPGTEINVYQVKASVTDHEITNSGQLKYSYDTNSTSVTSALVKSVPTTSISTTYLAAGSYANTVKHPTNTNIQVGMAIVGAGFASGQTVTSVLDNNTVVLSAVPDSALTDGQALKFTFNYAGSNTLSLTTTTGINKGDIITCPTLNVFAYDIVVEDIDTTYNTVKLGSYNNSSVLTGTAISGNGTTVTIIFATQTRIFYPVNSLINVTGFAPTAYNGIFKVTASTLNSVSYSSTVSAPSTKMGTIIVVVDSVIFNDSANNISSIPDATTVNFSKTLVEAVDVVTNINGTVDLIDNPVVGTHLVISGRTNPVRLDDAKYGTVDQTNADAIMQTPFPVLSVTITDPGQYITMPVVTFGHSELNHPVATAIGDAVMTAVDVSYNGDNIGTGYTEGDVLVATPSNGVTPVVMTASIENSTLVVSSVASGTIEVGMVLNGSGVAHQQSPISIIDATGDGFYSILTFASVGYIPFAIGQTITVTGILPTTYNGTYTVVDSTLTSVTYLNNTSSASFIAILSNGSGGPGNILNVSQVNSGTITVGQIITGLGIPPGTIITNQGTGRGFGGTYIISYNLAFINVHTTITSATPMTTPGVVLSRAVTYITSYLGTLENNNTMWSVSIKQTTPVTTITGSSAVVFTVAKVASFTKVGPIDLLQILSSTTFTGSLDATAQQPLLGGSGQDGQITIIYGVKSVTLTNPGGGYLNNPSVTFSSGIKLAKATSTIRRVTASASYTDISLPITTVVNAGDEFILRQSTSDGSVAPAENDYDTAISGGNLAYSTATGILADDINIDGDGFNTPTSSPAPEEVLPGQVVDTVAIKVYDESPQSSADINVANFVGDGVKAIFDIGQFMSSSTALIVKVNGLIKLLNTDYTVDFVNGKITLTTIPANLSTINIFSVGIATNNILDNNYFIGDGVTTEFVTRANWQTPVSSIVYLDGQIATPTLFKTDSSYDLSNTIGFRFSVPPPANTTINYTITSGAQQNFSITQTETFVGNGGSTYPLTNPVGIGLPAETNMIVIVDQQVLRAPTNSYFTVTKNQLTYKIDPIQFAGITLKYNDVGVYISNKILTLTKDYTVDLETGIVSLKKSVVTKNVGNRLVISVRSKSEYTYNATTKALELAQNYNNTHNIQVMTSYNHDIISIERNAFTFAPSITTTAGSVEYYFYQKLSNGIIKLEHPVINSNYVWITRNNILLNPGVDYRTLQDNQTIQLGFTPDQGDVFALIIFGNQSNIKSKISYMQFKDMLNRVVYKRLSLNKRARLVQDLKWNDTEIIVDDASNFDSPNPSINRPGIVEIRGERIEYFTINDNRLSQLRRGTLGTGVYQTSVAGTYVQDIGPSSTIPYNDTTNTRQFISDGVNQTIILDTGVELASGFTDTNSLFEVFVGGQNDLVRLKKSEYIVYDVNQYGEATKTIDSVQYLESGNVVYPADYTVTNVSSSGAEINLRKTVPQGTQITVVTRTGVVWDGDKSTNPANVIDNLGDVGSFIKASEGIWYTDYKN